MGFHSLPDENYLDDHADEYDHLLESGWWTSEQVQDVTDAIKALQSATIYEDGDKNKGISPEFLMRMTLLSKAADLDIPAALVEEAEAYFKAKERSTA